MQQTLITRLFWCLVKAGLLVGHVPSLSETGLQAELYKPRPSPFRISRRSCGSEAGPLHPFENSKHASSRLGCSMSQSQYDPGQLHQDCVSKAGDLASTKPATTAIKQFCGCMGFNCGVILKDWPITVFTYIGIRLAGTPRQNNHPVWRSSLTRCRRTAAAACFSSSISARKERFL